MAARPLRKRNLVRALERQDAKLHKVQEQLFRSQPGGSTEHPIEVASASMIEPWAAAVRCPRCDLTMHIEQHLARTIDARRLREVVTLCMACRQRRSLWFQIVQLLN